MMSEHNNVQATIARGLQELHASGDKRILGVCVCVCVCVCVSTCERWRVKNFLCASVSVSD